MELGNIGERLERIATALEIIVADISSRQQATEYPRNGLNHTCGEIPEDAATSKYYQSHNRYGGGMCEGALKAHNRGNRRRYNKKKEREAPKKITGRWSVVNGRVVQYLDEGE